MPLSYYYWEAIISLRRLLHCHYYILYSPLLRYCHYYHYIFDFFHYWCRFFWWCHYFLIIYAAAADAAFADAIFAADIYAMFSPLLRHDYCRAACFDYYDAIFCRYYIFAAFDIMLLMPLDYYFRHAALRWCWYADMLLWWCLLLRWCLHSCYIILSLLLLLLLILSIAT